jgi:hypothetical protein
VPKATEPCNCVSCHESQSAAGRAARHSAGAGPAPPPAACVPAAAAVLRRQMPSHSRPARGLKLSSGGTGATDTASKPVHGTAQGRAARHSTQACVVAAAAGCVRSPMHAPTRACMRAHTPVLPPPRQRTRAPQQLLVQLARHGPGWVARGRAVRHAPDREHKRHEAAAWPDEARPRRRPVLWRARTVRRAAVSGNVCGRGGGACGW